MCPQPSLPTESVRYFPTVPEEFARPSGNVVEREFSNRRADSQALAARTTARALARFSVSVFLSTYKTPSPLPSLPTTTARAMAPVIRVRWPVFIAGGSNTWLELKLDAVVQPRPHWPQ